MSELNPVRIAVIGAGAMGRNHIRFVTEEPEAELVAIADAFEGARSHGPRQAHHSAQGPGDGKQHHQPYTRATQHAADNGYEQQTFCAARLLGQLALTDNHPLHELGFQSFQIFFCGMYVVFVGGVKGIGLGGAELA